MHLHFPIVNHFFEWWVYVRGFLSGGICPEVFVRRYMSGGVCPRNIINITQVHIIKVHDINQYDRIVL